jgi:catechol 2,3-dioxygenase-like lactoylglutathione lyase family enzyme
MTRMDHVNVVVTDMDRSITFYTETLGLARGFETVLEGGWIETVTGIHGARARCVFMEAAPGGARLELLQYLAPAGAALAANSAANTVGIRHVAFVVEDLDALHSRLTALGARPVGPPVEVPFQVAAQGRKRLFYFHDPDGTLLEAAEYR